MRRALRLFVFGLLAATPVWAEEPARPSDDQLAFFETKIRPVLVTHCYECHAAESKTIQGGLRVDHAEGLRKGGDSGAAIVPGDVEASLLLAALKYDGVEMPPKGKLPDAVLKDFETWILMGAPDPRKAAVELPTRSIDIEEGRKHWAFQPVANPEPPQVQDASWPLDPLDRFLLAKLDAAGVGPNADVDRHTWLRRVSLDLTGLPPTLSEIEAFLQDSSPAAWEQVVDRLLASRGYGERWARHWLDLTGYADQVGTSNNIFAEHAWRYRDYLIDAFNADKPFDRFLREQIAGDLLPFETPQERAANLVATGFLVLGDVEVVNPDKLKMETDHIDQQVTKVGQTFMAMTIGCVRCHDHKFDPIALQDYYGLAGMFRSTVSTGKIPNGIWSGINIVELPETAEQTADREQRTREHQMRLDRLIAEQKQLQEEQAGLNKQLESLKDQPESERAPLVKRRDEIGESLKMYPAQIEHARFFAPTVPKAFAVQDSPQQSDMPVYIRGNPYTPGAVVPRGIVRVAAWSEGPPIPTGQSGRLQLADWLADKRHPLTARVAVNRVWQKLFGVGLVKSVDYFGTRGELPTHPDLLDHLATRFMQEGWSQKRLIRALVLSRAYRLSSGPNAQATAIDPDNALYWRMNRQRLDAEALRDSLLAVSGQLPASTGGPSLPLEYPENSFSLAPQAVNPPAFALRKFRPSQEFERTIYLPIVRSAQQGPARLRDVFDFTQPAQMAGERPQTVVPTQALFLLNNELVRKRATAIAEILIAGQADRTVRLEQLWLRVLNRPLTSVEREESLAFLDSLAPLLTDPATAEVTAWSELSHALLSSNEFIHRL